MFKTDEYTHLHVHTDASFIDGLGTVDHLVSHAKSLGFTALGLTDHGVLTNTILFISTCLEYGLKPIIGMEGYVNVNNTRFHITLLANGNKGFKSLVELNNIGVENFHNRPTFDIGDFKQHNEGLYLLTGCPSSPMQMESYSDSKENFRYLKQIFGDRMFIEMMLVEYGTPYLRAIQLFEDFGRTTPIVVTNDVHFANKDHKDLHQILLKMNSGGHVYDSSKLYLATPQELIERLTIQYGRSDLSSYLEMGLKNAGKLANILETPQFNSNPKLPHIPNADKKLWKLIEEGYQNRVKSGQIQDSSNYRDRYHMEYNTIKSMGFSSYFMILHDIINYAHKQNVWVGGRGSGAGSLVLYLIGITNVDPLQHGLLFERFLNHKRQDMPDVDVDLSSDKRDLVIDYSVRKYGATPIANYATYGHKSLMMDLTKQFGLPNKLALQARENGEDSAQFKQLCVQYPKFKKMYDVLNNQIKHLGKHAGGVVINEDGFPLPLIKTKNGGHVVAWTEGTYRELSKVGLVKFDLLGIKSGSVVSIMCDKYNLEIPEPTDNHPAYELFKTGNIAGVFQMDTSGNIEILKKIEPNKFSDIVAVNALCRPGPKDSGATDEYPQLKRNNTRRYLHPDIDHFLDDTYGIICYQEQFMQIIGYVFNGDLADADLARKVLTKAAPNNPEWVKKFQKLELEFFEGANKKGWTQQETKKVWDEIKTHSGYSFNKSHSVIYSYLTWQMLWLKYNYPVRYFATLLNVYHDNAEKTQEYMVKAVLEGIKFKNPDINISTDQYEADEDNNAIYLPLTVIKGIAELSYEKMATKRPFSSIQDYMDRVPKSYINKRGRIGACGLGAFNSIANGLSEQEIANILEVEDTTQLTNIQRQQQFLGFVLPTEKFIKAMEEADKFGIVVGIVDKKEKRNKGRGDYEVLWLSPSGTLTHNQLHMNIQVGDAIGARVKEGKNWVEEFYKVDY